jgi:hypothetical protein
MTFWLIVVAVVVIVAALSWRVGRRRSGGYMTERDRGAENAKGEHGGFTGYGSGGAF